ncbi:MAG TPA: FkbM family methyltransferase, partial [Rubricoccaceae bacterium]
MNHVVAEGEGVSVPVVTLDDAIKEDGPLVLKMDVEGWETEALAGARRLLDAPYPRALVLELNGSGERYGFDEAVLHRDLLARGYAPFVYHPFRRSLESLGDRTSDAGNTLYLNDAPFFRTRVASAPPFRVFGERI